jgi:hypothetical protein
VSLRTGIGVHKVAESNVLSLEEKVKSKVANVLDVWITGGYACRSFLFLGKCRV